MDVEMKDVLDGQEVLELVIDVHNALGRVLHGRALLVCALSDLSLLEDDYPPEDIPDRSTLTVAIEAANLAMKTLTDYVAEVASGF